MLVEDECVVMTVLGLDVDLDLGVTVRQHCDRGDDLIVVNTDSLDLLLGACDTLLDTDVATACLTSLLTLLTVISLLVIAVITILAVIIIIIVMTPRPPDEKQHNDDDHDHHGNPPGATSCISITTCISAAAAHLYYNISALN